MAPWIGAHATINQRTFEALYIFDSILMCLLPTVSAKMAAVTQRSSFLQPWPCFIIVNIEC